MFMTKTSIFQHIPTYTSKKFCLCSTFSHICSHNMSMPTHICLFHQIPIIIYHHISIISYLILPTYSHHVFTNKSHIYCVFFQAFSATDLLRPGIDFGHFKTGHLCLGRFEQREIAVKIRIVLGRMFFFNPHYIYIYLFIYIYVHYLMIYT